MKQIRSHEFTRTKVSLDALADILSDLGMPPLQATQLHRDEIPDPFRPLLVHRKGMTRTLEAAYGKRLKLKTLQSVLQNSIYTRQVVLLLGDADIVTEMAFIRIHLEAFLPALRNLILEEAVPLGTIFRLYQVDHYYKSSIYFSLKPDSLISEYLPPEVPNVLYGRRIIISNSSDHTLADSIEIPFPIGVE